MASIRGGTVSSIVFSRFSHSFMNLIVLFQAFDELSRNGHDSYDWAEKDKVIILEEDLEIGEIIALHAQESPRFSSFFERNMYSFIHVTRFVLSLPRSARAPGMLTTCLFVRSAAVSLCNYSVTEKW